MRNSLIILAFCLIIQFPGITGQAPDSLVTRLKNHQANDTVKVTIFNDLAMSLWGTDPPQTKYYAEQALHLARELKYTKGIADAYKGISRYYWTQTEYDKSMDHALMALKEYERCGYQQGVSWCYGSIGINYSQANNHDKSIYYHIKALELNRKIKNIPGIARDLNNLGYSYELKKDYIKALDYYKEALTIRLLLNNKTDHALSYSNVGSIYSYVGNYPLALQYLFKSLSIVKEVKNKNYIALNYQNIGEIYYKTKKYTEGELYLKNALKIAHEIGDRKRKEGVFESLRNLEQSRKNYKGALVYADLLQQLRDTLYTNERSRQMAEMEARFETKKKEQAIKLLKQEKIIHTLWRNILAGGVVFIALISVVIYLLQRSRAQKTKLLLEIQQSLNDKLKEIDKLKSRFFANISHEFRTPLTLILAPLEEKLKVQDISATEKESLLLMRRNANRLLQLVNQLLDLSKLEAGKMKLTLRQGNPRQFLNGLLSTFDSIACSKKIRFIKNLAISSEDYWYDSDVLEKIVSNLLSNAFKFTPQEGEISISVRPERNQFVKGNCIKIQVTDNGRGIPKEEQTEVFSPFYQARNTEDGKNGTGLGLPLVKELIKLYGGKLEMVSQENLGTSFTIYLPTTKESFNANQILEAQEPPSLYTCLPPCEDEEPELLDEVTEDAQKSLILIVEDNIDLRNFMSSVLRKEFAVIIAPNGQLGLHQANKYIPSLIISDLMMPEMDGMELTRLIKANESTSHIPVILLTARNEQKARLDGLKTGADDYLTKPFSVEELYIRITNLIAQRKRLALKYKERIMVLPASKQGISMEEKFLQKALAIVEDNIEDYAFSVEKMSEEMNMSRTQLLRKLKALTGLSPHEFIKDLRLKRAAELILSNADSLAQISYSVGFNDQSYFTKCFKKQYGVSPSEFKELEAIGNKL